MVIMTKQAVLFSANGEKWRAPNGFIGKCPSWVSKTRQFKEMVSDDMIVATESTSDKAMNNADKKAEKKGKNNKGGKKPENPSTPPENEPENPEGGNDNADPESPSESSAESTNE